MLISFFEEFPTKKNLNKLKYIDSPTKLYLAAPSLKQFQKTKSKIKNKHVKEVIYWPTLTQKEGYWISPFSQKSALKRIFKELKNKNTPTMLDLEFPTTQNPKLYFTQLLNFFSNKTLIKNFIKNYSGNTYLAEYYPEGKKQEMIFRFLGLHYKADNIIKMTYHSMHHFNKRFFIKEIKRGQKDFNNFILALGVIYPGIQQNEPLLSPQQLKKDLEIARNNNVKEVIIFRLAGLNKTYKGIIKNFL